MGIGLVVLENLLYNDQFTSKVIPFLKEEYFESVEEQIAYKLISEYLQKYSSTPSKEELYLELEKSNLNQKIFDETKRVISLFDKKDYDEDWLIDNAEQFCKERAIYNALKKSISIANSDEKQYGQIISTMEEALSVSFDSSIGHRYFEDAEKRWNDYHNPQNKIPFKLKFLNKITKGGVSHKTLNVLMGGLGVGKTLVMCSLAADYLSQGKNVLYVSLEMGETGDPSISERIDANCLDLTIDELLLIPKDIFLSKIKKFKEKSKAELVIKEFPANSVTSLNIKSLLKELKLKNKYTPDVIFIDYLNLMASASIKLGANVNTYYYVKKVAEELRAISQETLIPVWSATQTNRDGLDNSDVDLGNTSESIGLPQTVDLFLAIMQTEDLRARGQYLFKQLKNRYRNYDLDNKFFIGVHKEKMRLYDAEDISQDDIVDDRPVMDNSTYHEKLVNEAKGKKKNNKKKFEGFT